MFKNMGGKIKKLAKFCCWVSIIIWVLIGFFMMMAGLLSLDMLSDLNFFGLHINGTMILVIGGAAAMVLGTLFSWTGSFFLYGLGELIENHSIETAIMVRREMEMKE